MAKSKISVAIAGASGYAGGELIRLLLDHPNVELAFLSSERGAGTPVNATHPSIRNHPRSAGLKFRKLEDLTDVDVLFACLPTGVLPARVPEIAERARRVINLAGDFRLSNPEEIAEHYPVTAATPPAEPFTYHVPDLSPVPPTRCVNLPGCMAVATIYALYPLFSSGLAKPNVVVDAKTGSSGSGRETGEHPADRSGNFRVHKLHGHRHGPEIRQALTELTGITVDLQFSAHSLDVPRGILITGYARLRPGVTPLDVKRAAAKAYLGRAFVRVRNSPRSPQDFPMLKAVLRSNVAEVALVVRNDRVVVVCALDNLIKGAAGQAIQVLNAIHGLNETAGLPLTAAAP